MLTVFQRPVCVLLAVLFVAALPACSSEGSAEADGAAPPTTADLDTTETRAWLARMNEAWQRMPVQFKFQIDLMMLGMSHEGQLIRKGPRHYRMEIETGAFGRKGLSKFVIVCDGETLWQEMDAGVMSMVVKDDCEDGDMQLDPSQGGENPGGMVLSWIEGMSRASVEEFASEITFEGQDGNEVRLQTTEFDEAGTFTLILDRRTAFPRRLEMIANGQQVITITYNDVEFLRPAQVPDKTFAYSPPAGARVTDRRR